MARGNDTELRLKLLCFRAVREHFSALAPHIAAVLPTVLLEELQPHLTVCQLDQLQPALNSRGVSTYSGWREILGNMWGPSRVMDVCTEEEAKFHVMKGLFSPVLYGFKSDFIIKNASSLNTASFLRAAAKCIKHFVLLNLHKPLKRLTCEQRPVLDFLEEHISSVSVSHSVDPTKPENHLALLVLHRLLDHGCVRKVVVQARCPLTLAWILDERGSQSGSCGVKNLTSAWSCADEPSSSPREDQGPTCKRPRLRDKEGRGVCDRAVGGEGAGLCDGLDARVSSAACPRGHIESLELRQCHADCLTVLLSVLPSWNCLKSLTLHSYSTIKLSGVMDLSCALRELSGGPGGGLTQLNISTIPCLTLLEVLLEACPHLLSLSVEIQNVLGHCSAQDLPTQQNQCQVPLQKLSVSMNQQHTHGLFFPSLLRRCPQLWSLHVSGLRLLSGSSHGELLSTLSESCQSLRSLSLEDVNLSDSLELILHLLDRCQLHELCLNDCRLLEKWTNKEECLQRLVSGLAAQTSLRTLRLAQNRIARYVPLLAQLFSGASHSALQRLDLSSNFIQPAELLEFSRRLSVLRQSCRFTLDLRRNPGDRDPHTWSSAVKTLSPFCVVLLEQWKSTDTMMDHISNM